MTTGWSVIEGIERSPHWREDCDDHIGGVLCWEGIPVALPMRSPFNSWTTPWGARNHVTMIPFENGWAADLRFEENSEDETSGSGHPLTHPEQLTLGGFNQRAMAEHEDQDGYVGDEWDFSCLKTGYAFAGAYVQWHMIEHLHSDDPYAVVPDLETLQRRLMWIPNLPSDPYEAETKHMELIS